MGFRLRRLSLRDSLGARSQAGLAARPLRQLTQAGACQPLAVKAEPCGCPANDFPLPLKERHSSRGKIAVRPALTPHPARSPRRAEVMDGEVAAKTSLTI
jgi:hypothetical protein